MGLLMPETMLIDPILDEVMPVQDTVVTRPYSMDVMRDGNEYEATDPTSWRLLLIAPEREMASV